MCSCLLIGHLRILWFFFTSTMFSSYISVTCRITLMTSKVTSEHCGSHSCKSIVTVPKWGPWSTEFVMYRVHRCPLNESLEPFSCPTFPLNMAPEESTCDFKPFLHETHTRLTRLFKCYLFYFFISFIFR